jgi:hypothetical protein
VLHSLLIGKNIRDEETAIMKKAFSDAYGLEFD